MTHTLGPWSYSPTGTWPETNHHLGIYSDHAKMPQVAKVEGMGINSEANARLIAAAPDLLSTLMIVRENLVRLAWEENSLMISAIDAAISKATHKPQEV